jgi:hypothetical protein
VSQNNESAYKAIAEILESKEIITDQTLVDVLSAAGIGIDSSNYESIRFMLKRFLFSARITQIYSFQGDDPATNLILEMLNPSYKYD